MGGAGIRGAAAAAGRASPLGVHASVVTRVLGQAGVVPAVTMPRPSKVDPYLPFTRETLEKYPRLRASRLLQNGAGARVHGQVLALPRDRRVDPAAAEGRGVPAPSDLARRTSPCSQPVRPSSSFCGCSPRQLGA